VAAFVNMPVNESALRVPVSRAALTRVITLSEAKGHRRVRTPLTQVSLDRGGIREYAGE
jgi:hypothetical protein